MKEYFFPSYISLLLTTTETGRSQCCLIHTKWHKALSLLVSLEASRATALGQRVRQANGWGTGPHYRAQVQALVPKNIGKSSQRTPGDVAFPCC